MKKLVASLVFLVGVSACTPAFGQSSQVYWHDQAQKEARKAQKQQQKAYKKAMKQQGKMMKKQQKQAKKDAKASHHA